MAIHVAVAVIEDGRGRVLLSKRHDHLHQGGLWEFPGGKLEPGENLEQALCREIVEELGIVVNDHRPLIQVRHDYGDREVLLDVHRVTDWHGQPTGRESQQLAWVGNKALTGYPMPAADLPIVSAIRLPACYLIASPDSADPEQFRQRLCRALESGIRLVQFRPALAGIGNIGSLLEVAIGLCRDFNAKLLLNSGVGLQLPDLGLHLKSVDLMSLDRRPDGKGLVAASCHDRQQLSQAARLRLDFAVLSPVLPTSSHPGASPLGWELFGDWVAETTIPVYALGGVGGVGPETAWQYGGQGIAGIRGLW